MKKFQFQHPTNKVLIFVVVLIIALMTAVLWDFGQKLDTLWQQNQNQPAMSLEIKFYIQSALKNLYIDQTTTDPLQKRVYFPEASIYIPMTPASRQLVYRYGPADQGIPEQLTITSASNVYTLPITFADVPCLQRHITAIFDSKSSSDGRLVGTTKLANGRTMYVYQSQETGCSGPRWSSYSASDITGLLKQAQSY